MKKLTLLLSLVLCTILGACGEKEEPVAPAGTIDFTVKADGAKVTLEWTADGKAYLRCRGFRKSSGRGEGKPLC